MSNYKHTLDNPILKRALRKRIKHIDTENGEDDIKIVDKDILVVIIC